MEKVSVLAITKNGIDIALELKNTFEDWSIYAPKKFQDCRNIVNWFSESTSTMILDLFNRYDAIVCIFSLGAVIRLIAPMIKDKKTDPAVVVIDDKKKFVISALSGHLGGANELATEIGSKIGAIPIITTAADVNNTIPVDLVGRKFGWEIEDMSNVTRISALMVNEEKVGILQETGEKNWWDKELPKNVVKVTNRKELLESDAKGFLIITDELIPEDLTKNAVIYRPKTLVIGIGLHWDTSKQKMIDSINESLRKANLSPRSVKKIASVKKPIDVSGLVELGNEMNVPVEYYEKEELSKVDIPNPSETVKKFEGTASVSEAASVLSSGGTLVLEKQKFPPDLTVAIARLEF